MTFTNCGKRCENEESYYLSMLQNNSNKINSLPTTTAINLIYAFLAALSINLADKINLGRGRLTKICPNIFSLAQISWI